MEDWGQDSSKESEQQYKCQHCGVLGLPSIWTLITKYGERVGLITSCANDLRHKFRDSNDFTIREPVE